MCVFKHAGVGMGVGVQVWLVALSFEYTSVVHTACKVCKAYLSPLQTLKAPSSQKTEGQTSSHKINKKEQ